jgi:hypothetical protein
LHVLAGAGCVSRTAPLWKDARLQLVLLAVLFPLALFSWPGVAVYDGERLFLMVFPLWAIVAGCGGQWAYERLRQRWSARKSVSILAAFLALQAYGVVALHPCYLSYYNLVVGGLRGADRLGLETTYWGDSVTRPLLQAVAENVPAGSAVAVAPVLHQFQLVDLEEQSPILRRRGIKLVPFERRQTFTHSPRSAARASCCPRCTKCDENRARSVEGPPRSCFSSFPLVSRLRLPVGDITLA